MQLETERVDFGDGSWWDIYSDMPYGVSRTVQKLVSPALKFLGDGNVETDSSKVTAELADQINMAMLVGCTRAWSVEEAVSEEAVSAWPRRKVTRVLSRMNELYREEVDRTALKKG